MGKKGYGSSGLGKVTKRGKNSGAVSGGSSRRQKIGKSRSAGPGQRQQSRWEAKAKAGRKDVRRAHSGEAEKEETRQRLRLKALQRQLARLTDSSPVDQRVSVLRDLGHMHVTAGRSQAASDAFRQILQLQPGDPDFIRTPLLCMHVDAAQTDEASEILKGPLFTPLLLEAGIDLAADARAVAGKAKARRVAGADVETGVETETQLGPSASQEIAGGCISSEARNAATLTACYTVALLTYISVRVLKEHGRKPSSIAAAEAKLARRLRAAQRQNPFVAEYIAFAPAFQQEFDGYVETADFNKMRTFGSEQMLIQALEYCCLYRQLAIWLDTNDEVRRYIQRTLFEEGGDLSSNGEGTGVATEEPPLAPLPSETPADHPVMRKWRKTREDALELWAEEMSTAGDCEGEEEESAESSSEALARAEAHMADD